MIPVDQQIIRPADAAWDKTREEAGDCLRAVVASIFELPLDAVPHFCDTGLERPGNKSVWAYALAGWCFTQGVVVDPHEVLNEDLLPLSGVPGYCILSGPGPRGWRHSVVGYQGRVVHDPHPSRDGLVEIDEIELLVGFTSAARELLARAPETTR